MDEPIIDHLERTKADIREEIKQRISQRDQFSVQLTIALAAIFAFSFSEHGTVRMLFAAPIASLYYTVLILYSYAIHDILAQYMREVVEPQLANKLNLSEAPGWETFYNGRQRPGIRREFFLWSHWVIIVSTCLIAVGDRVMREENLALDILLSAIVLVSSMILVTPKFWSRDSSENVSP